MAQLFGWLLYTKGDYERNSVFARRFLDKGNHTESTLKLVFKDDLFYGTYHNQLCLMDGAGNLISAPDFVINRSIDPLMSKHLEAMGVKVFNSSTVAEICNDKARTYLEISRLGLPMVDTLFIGKKELTQKALPFDFPVVIKTVSGRGGKEVFLARTADEVGEIARSVSEDRLVVQKLCGSPGKDVRVFVVGKKIAGAIVRHSKGDFKANFSLGGTAEAYRLNPKETEHVLRIINSIDFDMVGIDFIFDEKGDFLFNEIEDVAGSRTLSMTSSVDIVELYLEHIYSKCGL